MRIEDLKNDDHLLVSLLMSNDETAWRYLAVEVIKPLGLSDQFPFRDIFYKYTIPVDALVDMVYELLMKNDFALLRAFRFEGKFSTYLYWQIYDAGQRVIRQYLGGKSRKNRIMVSDDCLDYTLMEQTDSSSELMLRDDIARANGVLAKLWKKSPSYAFVLLLRRDLKLSSKTIGALLGKKPSNIDKIRERAEEKFNEYFSQSQE